MALFSKNNSESKKFIVNGKKTITLRKICDEMDITVPAKFDAIKNKVNNNLTASPKRISKGSFYFILRDKIQLKKEIEGAVKKGAEVIFVDKKEFDAHGLNENNYPVVLLDKKIKQIGAVYSKIRLEYPAKAIGIAGKRGKTITKRLIKQIFGSSYNLFVSGDNANTYLSVANHIINKLDENTELFVQELDAPTATSMKKSARMLKPDVCVFLNSRDYRKSKAESDDRKQFFERIINLDKFSNLDAVEIVNNDDDEIAAYLFKRDVISFGIDAKNAVNYRAINIMQKDEFLEFDIVEDETNLIHIKINGVGRQMIYNTLAAFAVGRHYHFSGDKISRALLNYRTTDLNGYFRKIGGKYIYLDSDEVNEFTIRDIRVLADEILQGKAQKVFTLIEKNGESKDELFYEELKINGIQNNLEPIIFLDGTEDAIDDAEDILMKSMDEGDLLVFRGTENSKISVLIDRLFNTGISLYWKSYNVEDIEIEDEKSKGRLIPELHKAEVTSINNDDGEIVYIPETIGQIPIYKTGRHLFKDNETIKELHIGKVLKNIGIGSFYNCSSLVTVTIPSNVLIIESGAFRNCKNLTQVILAEGVQHIEKNAFRGCEALESVYMPNSVSNIEDNAFVGCEHVEFHCTVGSFAQKYAKKNGIDVHFIN